MTFDKAAAAARFETRQYESGCGTIHIRKPRVRAYAAFLDVVRKCADEQKRAGDGAQFDPGGLSDLELVRISACDENGAPLFETGEEVESMLSPSEIMDVALIADKLIRPTANPTTAPAQS
jgi:hypothetical protein